MPQFPWEKYKTEAGPWEQYQSAPASDQAAEIPPTVSAVGPLQSTEAQLTLGAQPAELLNRVKGVARSVGRAGMGAIQYGQYLTGSKVSPTPLMLEPSLDPNQQIGEKIGRGALTVAPSLATSGASLPIQAAVGATMGGIEGGPTGAAIGGVVPVVAKGAAAALGKLKDVAVDKEWAAKLWNQVARVKAGRGGTQIDMRTGDFKTLPGRAMVRASGKEGTFGQVAEAFLARPNDATRSAAMRELSQANTDLLGKLARSPNKVDIGPVSSLGIKKAEEALRAAGLPPGVKAVRPDIAHKVTQELGDRINWNPNVTNEANDAMKDAWFAMRKDVSQAAGGVKADYKRWQESYLFVKALQGTMEKSASRAISPFLRVTAKTAAAGAVGGAAVKAYDLLTGH